MSAFVGYPCVLRSSFFDGDQISDVICAGVFRVCRRAPVLEFQMLIDASFVPPPEARREGCHGHQASA
jgi:hypothetical protein